MTETSPPHNLRKVSLESPFAGDYAKNIAYAKECMAHSIMQEEAPFASHLLYPIILDDTKMEQRVAGLAMGHAWRLVSDAIVVYTDLGVSPGMMDAIELAHNHGIPVEYRSIYQGGTA